MAKNVSRFKAGVLEIYSDARSARCHPASDEGRSGWRIMNGSIELGHSYSQSPSAAWRNAFWNLPEKQHSFPKRITRKL